MTTAEESTPSTSLVQDAQAFGWLLAVLANVGMGAWLLQRSAPPDPPPILAFVLFFIAALILYIMHDNNPAQQPEAPMQSKKRYAPANARPFSRVIAGVKTIAAWRHVLFALALMCAAYTLFRIPRMDRLDDYAAPFLAWGLSITCYAVALVPPRVNSFPRWARRLKTSWRRRRLAWLIFLNILLLSLLLRATFLESIPYTLGGDEASQGLEAVRVLQGEIRNPFTTGWLGVPTLSFFFNSLTIDALGMTKTGLRLPWALVGVATVAATFFLVRRLQGLTLALATAALLGAYHYHIHFSRLGSNQIADPLFVTLSLTFLYFALDRRQLRFWILTGVVVGLAFYFYAGARFTPVVILTVLIIALLRRPRTLLREHLGGAITMIGAFLLAAAPMLQYAVRFPDDFNARLNQVGIVQSGWLQRELAAGNELLPTIWEQFSHAILAFHYYPDRTVWYGLQQPLLDPLFGAIFAAGLLYATLLVVIRGERRLMPFIVWWWGGMLAGGVLTESPPSSQRLTTLAVPTCFFIAFALWHIVGLARMALPRLPGRLLLAFGVATFAIASLNIYFFEFTPQYRYGGRHAELATSLAPIFEELYQTHDAYFVGAPWMYWGFATIPFLSQPMLGQDLAEPLIAPPSRDLLRPSRGAIFIVRPERAAELAQIEASFPQGRQRLLHSRAPDHELLATLFIIPPRPAP